MRKKQEMWIVGIVIASLIIGGIIGAKMFSKTTNNAGDCQDYKLMSSQYSQWFSNYNYKLGDDCYRTFAKQDCLIKVLRTTGSEVDYTCWCR